ncbi:MAG TPA: DUF421 domain-containing protein [Bacillaceae bacterium]
MIYLDTVIKLVLGLVALITVTRLLGKKEMAQITPFDFVYALILGALLEESLYDDKITIWQMLFGVAVWAVLIYIVEILAEKNEFMRKLLKGNPSVIVKDGQLDLKALQKNHLEMEQLRTMMRKQGVFSFSEVRDMYLEPGGSISINKYSATEPPTASALGIDVPENPPSILLVDEGEISHDDLRFTGKSPEWLKAELENEGYPDIGKIFMAEWNEKDGFFVRTYEECSGKHE